MRKGSSVLFEGGIASTWGPIDGSVWHKPKFLEKFERWQEGQAEVMKDPAGPVREPNTTLKPQVANNCFSKKQRNTVRFRLLRDYLPM